MDGPPRQATRPAWVCRVCTAAAAAAVVVGDAAPPEPSTSSTSSPSAAARPRECVFIGGESRCLCGERLRAHLREPPRRGPPAGGGRSRCRGYCYLMAEGTWVVRCRCKHRHTDHDAATRACAKAGCKCTQFSPTYVCNCGHDYASHETAELPFRVSDALAAAQAEMALAVHVYKHGRGGEGGGGGGAPQLPQ